MALLYGPLAFLYNGPKAQKGSYGYLSPIVVKGCSQLRSAVHHPILCYRTPKLVLLPSVWSILGLGGSAEGKGSHEGGVHQKCKLGGVLGGLVKQEGGVD